MHCHISHHLTISMGLVFEEGLKEAQAIFKVPQQSVELCKLNGIDVTSPSNAPSTITITNVLVVVLLNTLMLL